MNSELGGQILDVTTAYGLTFLFPIKDQIVGQALRSHGEFARPEVDLISAYLDEAPDGAFIDVGANIGSICLPIAARHPSRRVIAIEAHRGVANILAANALNNRLHNLEPIHAAVGDAERIVRFPTPLLEQALNFGATGMHLRDDLVEPVRMSTLDDLAPTNTRLIKIDVEGFEAKVLQGASRTLALRQAVWLFESKAADPNLLSNLSLFRSAGYELFWFFAPFVTPSAKKPFSPQQHLGGDFNCVALPPGVRNLWELPEVKPGDTHAPGGLGSYNYLARYGFK